MVVGSHLPSSSVEHGVDEGHDGRLQVDLVSVAACTPVQLIQQCLGEQNTQKIWQVFP